MSSLHYTLLPPDASSVDQRHRQVQALPLWLREYILWHRKQLSDLSKACFLVVSCHREKCGGLADRLSTLPALLYLCSQHKRVLLLHWSRPTALEEFVIPPRPLVNGNTVLGCNWTVPTSLREPLRQILHDDHQSTSSRLVVRSFRRLTQALPIAKHQPILVASIQYDRGMDDILPDDLPPDTLYHHLFPFLFEPTPPIQTRIDQWQPTRPYVAAHLRASYGQQPLGEHKLRAAVWNAVACARQLLPTDSVPILFVSDTRRALEYAQQANVVSVARSRGPVHLDDTSAQLSDYYDTFVDLYLLAGANCVAYGRGGFGRLGARLARNVSCQIPFYQHGAYVDCT